MYFYLDQFYTEASLPPLPYTPFDENAYNRLTERASKVVFTTLHGILRGIPKGRGYKDLGIDVLRRYLDPSAKVKDDELVNKLVSEFSDPLNTKGIKVALMKFWKLDKTKKESIEPIHDVSTALKDYEYALKHIHPEQVGTSKAPKTLTVAPIHVPWSKSLRKIDGFILTEFAGVQKNAPTTMSKDVPFGKMIFKETPEGMKSVPWKKSAPTSPPSLIFARKRNSFRPLQPDPDNPHPTYGLGRKLYKGLKRNINRGDANKLKSFLQKQKIPHEKVTIPSIYDRVIVQYLSGPWRDRRFPGKPFRVSAFIKGDQVYENVFSTQREAERAVSVWTKTILKSKGKTRGEVRFSYNRRKFYLSPEKTTKVLKVLEKGHKFKLPRTEGIYLIFRGEPPKVRNTWLVRQELEKTHAVVMSLSQQALFLKKKLDKSADVDKMSLRAEMIRVRKELQTATERYEKAQEGAKIDREVAERIAPMKIKPLKASIRLVMSHE